MIETCEHTPETGSLAGASYLGPARIIQLNPADQLVLVEWQRSGETRRSWARPATATPRPFTPGDAVLVISQDLQHFYLIGCFDTNDPVPAALETKAGARAILSQSASEEILQVHSPQGELVLEYHPASGKTRINLNSGDLEFVARNGSIAFHSAQDIRFGARAVNILSRHGTALGVKDARGNIRSSLALLPDGLTTHTQEINVTAERGKVALKHSLFTADTFRTEIGVLKLVARRLETFADTVVDRIKNVYRNVEELAQLQAGRLRTLVKGACHLKARDAFLKADENFKLDGERIDLG
jgi:hypothetical protein